MTVPRFTTHRPARPAIATASHRRVPSWTGRAVVSCETDTTQPRAASANTHRTRVSEMRFVGRPGCRFDTKQQLASVAAYRAHGNRQVRFAIEANR